ncbi:MAG: cation-translocating P-type ATPase, partial [Nitrospira sp.]
MELPKDAPAVKVWHAIPAEALVAELRTNLEAGLSTEEAIIRQQNEGFNELPEASPPSLLKLFFSQFTSVIVWVLIGAAVVSGLMGEGIDTIAILAIVLLNGLLGFVQEYKAERSLAALQKMSVSTARAMRGGVLLSIPARELVPGDLILLEAGDRVPADARLIYAVNVQSQESTLTGESTPVQKDAAVLTQAEVALADRTNMAFMGTMVVSGKARALVATTGLHTELGRIATMIRQVSAAERTETPLQRRLEQFGYTLLWLALGVVAVVFALGYWRGEPLLTMFLTSVSLAVAAVPEGLPAVVTITLALGVTRMAKRHALIRKLPAVETLGSATVICTDKTGTLTKNEMTVTKLLVGDVFFDVTGEGYAPAGEIVEKATIEVQAETVGGLLLSAQPGPQLQPGLRQLLTAAVLCNGATLNQEGGAWSVIGDPTEGALLVVAAKGGVTQEAAKRDTSFAGEIPFDAERKRMTVLRQTKDGTVAYVKGAPDVLLSRCA